MKKIFKILFTTFIMIISVCCVSSCSKISTKNVSNAEELHKYTKGGSVEVKYYYGTSYTYHGDKTNINITDDFTIMTDDDFFTYRLADNMPGRILENMTFDGNGHTITIKGEVNGSLGKYNKGLFARLINCTVKNINIVYEVDLNINGSSGSYFGGFCGDANKCSFENVNISYNRNTAISFMTDQHGYHDSKFGGLVGVSGQSTYNNCKVSGSLYGTSGYFGGLLGYTYQDVVIKDSLFEGSIKTVYLEESFVGGLVGFCAGEVYSSKVLVNKLEYIGEPQAWRNRTSSVGGLVGKLEGNLHDSYLEFKENGYFYAERKNNGTFSTVLNTGVLVGEATKGSKVKNVYADGSNDSCINIKFADVEVFTHLGIGKSESTEVSNIFYVDDSYYYDYEETFESVKNINDNYSFSFNGTIHGENAIVKVVLEYDEDNEYHTDHILLTIGSATYELGTVGFNSNSIQIEYSTTENNINYNILIKPTENDTYGITFSKKREFIDTDILVSSYDDIVFDLQENVIGSTNDYWKYDSQTNKPLLNSID